MNVSVAVLHRPLYTIAEAADLLGMRPQKLRRWLDGYAVAGVWYEPVIREAHTGSDIVTWAEFVEASLLAEYRTDLSLQYLRTVIVDLRDRTGAPYPLAHEQPYVDQSLFQLIFRVQEESGAEPPERLVELRRTPDGKPADQLVLAPTVETFVRKVEFDAGVVARLWPMGRDHRVLIDPDVSFGVPTVEGIRTEVLGEAHAAGDNVTGIARAWDLDVSLVEEALVWEQLRASAKSA
jgi:uncharacterized protein (DUF433 family)